MVCSNFLDVIVLYMCLLYEMLIIIGLDRMKWYESSEGCGLYIILLGLVRDINFD